MGVRRAREVVPEGPVSEYGDGVEMPGPQVPIDGRAVVDGEVGVR